MARFHHGFWTLIAVLLVAGQAAGQVEFEYLSEAELAYFIQVPAAGAGDAPIFVAVHGSSRNADSMAETFAPWAEKYDAVMIAPVFDEEMYDDYQRMWKRGDGRRADESLIALIDHLGAELGAASDRVLLFGYSGGAQFAHRFAMAHPERVEAAVVSSPGWYTWPDADVEYAYGTGPTDAIDVTFEPLDYLEVPMLVTVGSKDRKRDSSLRKGFVDGQQGRNRYTRAKNWRRAMRDHADDLDMPRKVKLKVLKGAGHSFSKNVRDYGLDGITADYLLGGGAN